MTDSNGNYSIGVWFLPADFWQIRVSSYGASDPGFYWQFDNNQIVTSLDFSFIPDEWNFAFDVNGEQLNFFSSPPYQTSQASPIEVCAKETICIGLENSDVGEQFVNSILGTNDCYQFRLRIWTTNAYGNPVKFVGEDCFQLDGRPAVPLNECGAYAFNVNDIIAGSELDIINVPLYVEISQFCCTRTCSPGEKGLVNREHFFLQVNDITDADVSFQFLATFTIDALNQSPNESSQMDGLEPTSTIALGPELGPFSIGVDADIVINSGNPLDEVTYTVETVDCITGGNEEIIFEKTVPLNSSGIPENFIFLDQFQVEIDGELVPYFTVSELTDGVCYKITVTATNDCGSVSDFSYFTITDNCFFCMVGDDGVVEEVLENLEIDSGNNLNEISVYPNPVRSQLTFETDLIKPVQIDIINTSGTIIDRVWVYGRQAYDTTDLPAGTYYYKWVSAGKTSVDRFVKL